MSHFQKKDTTATGVSENQPDQPLEFDKFP